MPYFLFTDDNRRKQALVTCNSPREEWINIRLSSNMPSNMVNNVWPVDYHIKIWKEKIGIQVVVIEVVDCHRPKLKSHSFVLTHEPFNWRLLGKLQNRREVLLPIVKGELEAFKLYKRFEIQVYYTVRNIEVDYSGISRLDIFFEVFHHQRIRI